MYLVMENQGALCYQLSITCAQSTQTCTIYGQFTVHHIFGDQNSQIGFSGQSDQIRPIGNYWT